MNITTPHMAGPDGSADTAGPQILVSMPMFCGADERLLEEVEGLQCDMDSHMTWIDVEPTTGTATIECSPKAGWQGGATAADEY